MASKKMEDVKDRSKPPGISMDKVCFTGRGRGNSLHTLRRQEVQMSDRKRKDSIPT